MKGKILDTGTILGNDGKHYAFSQDNVINIKDRSIESFIGSEVDFVESGANAQSIYIYTNKGFKDIIFSSDIRSIKYKIFYAMAFYAISFILFFASDFLFTRIYLHYLGINEIIGKSIAIACVIVGIVLVFMALRALSYESGSKTLTRNYSIAIVLAILGVYVDIASFVDIEVGMDIDIFNIFYMAGLAIEVSIIAVVALITRELAFIMKQKYILYAFYLNICGSLIDGFAVSWVAGLVLYICALALYIVALVQFSEIRKRTDSDAMPWFPK